jgi:flagellar basal body rod protein FlgG
MGNSEIMLARWLSNVADTQDLVSHNLANLSTPGYKRKLPAWSAFDAELEQGRSRVPMLAERQDFAQGSVYATENEGHLAIEGPGFFKVRGADGVVRYTRGGEIHKDPTGNLVDAQGFLLLDESDQPVNAGNGPGGYRVGPRGTVSGRSGEELGRLGLVAFPDPQALRQLGNGLWSAPKGVAATLDQTSRIHQGSLERSNSDSISELISMIKIQRSFQSGTRLLSSIQSSEESLINAIK